MYIKNIYFILIEYINNKYIYIYVLSYKGKLKKFFFQSGSNPVKDKILRKGPYVGFAGWAVNSMTISRRRFDSFSS